MKATFLGGARTVTGSMHLLETAHTRVLLDCGLFQGHRDEAERINREVPAPAVTADFMILSHAHIDHCGNIPNLVKRGFNHEIYTTLASRDLAELLLRDSAHIQESDLKFLNKKLARSGLPAREPIYTVADAEASLKYLTGIAYGLRLERGDVAFTLSEAGHILGSAQVTIEVEGKRLVYTGDLGRSNLPIIRDPAVLTETDYLVMESTYGGRLHPAFEAATTRLAEVINRVWNRGGRVIVPAFALERTQELLYALNQLAGAGRIPSIPVFVDSPLASGITEVFRRHTADFDAETRALLARHDDPFAFPGLHFVSTTAESMKLNDSRQPCIIISASGMCENGRILHHLKHSVTDPKNLVLIVGFAAENTLARRIVERQPEIRIFGEMYPLRAEVETIEAFSAHADQNDLLTHVRHFDRNHLKRIFLVHGELTQSEALQKALVAEGYDAVIPEKGGTFAL
jgi:metallo-beta-lactamase family protein